MSYTHLEQIANLKEQLRIAHEMQSAFQERLYREVDKNAELDKEVAFLFSRNLILEGQLKDANGIITDMAGMLGIEVEAF
ncbi:hypothetical protein [Pseudomonas sp.]|uniref:hypothetical protein n=1 Tax=Pseudomonas sp. TaxID=306 RepID=UPI002FC9DEAB